MQEESARVRTDGAEEEVYDQGYEEEKGGTGAWWKRLEDLETRKKGLARFYQL